MLANDLGQNYFKTKAEKCLLACLLNRAGVFCCGENSVRLASPLRATCAALEIVIQQESFYALEIYSGRTNS
jgi:hypothetical protein